MSETFILTLISGLFVSIASGLVGSFLVLRKMTLLADALSHVALPGIALGIILKFEPIIGGLVFLFLGVLLIWGVEEKTKLAIESITGVLFVTALAVGALIMPQTELLETFFGSVEKITNQELILQTVIAFLIIFLTFKYLKPLVLASIAPELGTTTRLKESFIKLLLLVLIALTITIGISFVGILLMSAISIIPAVTARNLASSYKGFLGVSITLAVLSLLGGLTIGNYFSIAPGIATVLISSFIFLISLFKR